MSRYTAREIAQALNITRQAADKRAKKESWPSSIEGKKRLYPYVHLPIDVQSALAQQESGHDEREAPLLQADAQALEDPEVARRKRAVQEALKPPEGWTRKEWIELHVGPRYSATRATVYRWIKRYQEESLAGLATKKGKRGPRAWDEEAIRYWQGMVLKREHRSYSINALFERFKRVAEREGWNIGGRTSAYQLAQQIDERLTRYRDGGSLGLDNACPPIRRDFTHIMPLDCIVGDQHKFDFWVWDEFQRTVLRPESYFWLDMRSRAIYGFALGRRYNAQMMALALRPGLTRLGKPKTLYNDNGKPERARLWLERKQNMENLDIEVAGIDQWDGLLADLGLSDKDRIFARAYNAKAKPIEGFFAHFERMLQDVFNVPGRVKDLHGLPEDAKQRQKELGNLAAQGKLLTLTEFMQTVMEAVRYWNEERVHKGHKMNCTPLEEIHNCQAQGWRPVLLDEWTADLAALYRGTRTVTKGEVHILGEYYRDSDESQNRLSHHNGERVQVRYDPVDADRVIVLDQNMNYICHAVRNRVPFGDKDAASEANRRKREEMQQMRELYRQLTKPVDGLLEYSKTVRAASEARKDRERIDSEKAERERVRGEEEIEREEAELTQNRESFEAFLRRMGVEIVRESGGLVTDRVKHYAALLQRKHLFVEEMTEAEESWMAEFEAKLTESQLEYWRDAAEHYRDLVEHYRSLNTQTEKEGVNA